MGNVRKKIGIVLPFQNGDFITGTSVLKYKDVLWPECDIIWFCNEPHSDALRFQDIEIRYFPHGWAILENDIKGIYTDRVQKDKLEGRPEWEDWSVLMTKENRLNQELKHRFASFTDLDEAYFAAPWMQSPIQRHGLSYPNVSKKVFGIDFAEPWHPVLKFSDEERESAKTFIESMNGGKRVFIESFAGSSQSIMDSSMISDSMNLCFDIFGSDCNFIFGSHKFLRKQESFPDGLFENPNVYSAADFTVRQSALIAEKCHLMISVSSGLSVAASAWGLASPPIVQFCGSTVCSTRDLANGEFVLITADDKPKHEAKKQYYQKLTDLLNKHK